MHDPYIKIYSNRFFTLWHHDPCTDHSDDSCGWFMRARHGDQKILTQIEGDILFDWNCAYQPMFTAQGDPALSTIGIALNCFWHAAWRHFRGNRRKADRWMKCHLFDILLFAENPVDTLATVIQGNYGEDKEPKEYRARKMAATVYSWVLRKSRPWYKHPRWHIHHWRISCPALRLRLK